MKDIPHICTDYCKCPIHETELLYAPYSKEHACQDINCIYGHGLESVIEKYFMIGTIMTEPEMLCDGCGKIKPIVEPTEDGRALLCSECIKIKEWKITIYWPHPVGNGSPFEITYTGTREHMCNLMEALEGKKFGVRLQAEETDKGNTCHFCGTFVVNGYEIGPNRRNRHWLSDCRPDLVEHEPGELCTWHNANIEHRPDCYAYQNHHSKDREWTTEHKYFYKDGPMG